MDDDIDDPVDADGQPLDLLSEEITNLQASLVNLKETNKKLTTTIQEATKSYFDAADKAANIRLASLNSNPTKKQLEHLQELKHVQKICGFEIVAETRIGVSAIFHLWYRGEYIDKKSVAIEKSDDGQLIVLSHTLPLGSVPWLSKNLPCLVPDCTDIYKALHGIGTHVTGYFHRQQQLQEFKKKYSDIEVVYTANLSSIILSLDLCDTRSDSSLYVGLELLYKPGDPFPDDCQVSLNKKIRGITEKREKELIALVVEQFQPFKSMDLAEAFFFCVLSKDACREGYLLKQTCSFQRWRRRFFRLRGRTLFYAKQSKAAIFDEIDLRDASVAECGGRGTDYLGFKVITASRSLVLCAESRRDMEEWMSALRAAAAQEHPDVVMVPGSNRPRALSTSAQAEVLSGNHHWYATSHARPTYCNVCREALSGVTSHGLSCEVCKAKVHKRCACKTLNNCKWTTLASLGPDIIEDKEGNITMPHQWMEGNLPVSAKCSVCDKTCGSVLRLQDWRCLWCNATVHTACRPAHPVQCSLGPARVSVVPPTALHSAGSEEAWEAGPSPKLFSPLLVFVNSRSGDNQGLRFLRRFRQLLNPAQVFDLVSGGPGLGLRLFRHLKPFRVLVCGGDGSVGWVLTEIDRMGLHSHCRVGVLPLGTGNDLARVLGWGAACDHDANLPQLLERYEQATTKMLDRWSVLCLEREVLVQPGAESRKPSNAAPASEGEASAPSSEQGQGQEVTGEGDEEDDDDDDEVGEIPYVDMPGISLEEELEEDTLAAARLLSDRAERFLNYTADEEGIELRARRDELIDRLAELKQALKDHEAAVNLSPSRPNSPPILIPDTEPESDLEGEELELSEEAKKDKEIKEQANAARLRRSSCRRKVVLRADSVENALQEASNLAPTPSPRSRSPLHSHDDTPSSPLILSPPPSSTSPSPHLLGHPLLQTPSLAIHSPEGSRCPSPSMLGVPPSSFLSPSLTTNFPLLLTPVPSRPQSPSPGPPLLRPPSQASTASTSSDLQPPGLHVSWLPPPPSMFADGLGSAVCDSDGPPTVTVTGAGSDVPCVVVSAPSPDQENAPSPPPSPDENFLYDPFFLSDYRRSSHDSTCSSRRSSATRRISSGCLFGAPGEMMSHLAPPGSPALAASRSPPSPRGSLFSATPRGSFFSATPRGSFFSPSPRGSVSQQAVPEETNRKLPIINPQVPNVSGSGSSGLGFISQALLANADTLCAAVSPLMDHDDSVLEGFYERCVMNNYFGIGIDAKISLAFHQKREEHPEQCRSRARNYMWYGVLGSREALKRSCRKLEQRLTLECDGQRIPLPALQGIVVLNIPSFMGGTNFWGGSKGDECFLAPSFDDRILEVVAVFGSVQMAASRILSAQSHRIAQCSSVQISILGDEGVPVQVDGEAWIQPPGMIRIIHKNRMQMLCRNRSLENSLRSWEEKQKHQQQQQEKIPVPIGTNQSDDERLALLKFIEAVSSLVKCVKLLSIAHSTIPEELYVKAEQTSARLEALHPGGKIVETSELPTLVTQLVSASRLLHDDACHVVAEHASVKGEDELAPKLGTALLAMAHQLHMTSTDSTTGITTFLSEEQSKSRSPLPGLSWLRLRALRRGSATTGGVTTEDTGKGPRVGRAAVETWGAHEVATWLAALGLSDYRESFTQHDIQGRELLSLGRRDLRELGVEKLGHVKRILQGIKDLQTT